MTEKGSSAVQSQVNETFTETITSIGLKTVSSLLDYMSTDQVSNYIANLSSTLGDSIEDLPRRSGKCFVAGGHFELHVRFADVGERHAQADRCRR